MTAVAIGPGDLAAEAACAALDRRRDGDLRIVDRREADEPGAVEARLDVDLGGSGLAGERAAPSTESAAAVPSSTTEVIISVSCAAVSSLITSLCSSGSSSSVDAAVGILDLLDRASAASALPPLATVAATSAICDGGRQQRPLLAALADRDAGDVEAGVDELAAACRRRWAPSGRRAARPRGPCEAEALHVLEQRLGAERLADLRPIGVDGVASARRACSISPNCVAARVGEVDPAELLRRGGVEHRRRA